jgi:hypothetical protein
MSGLSKPIKPVKNDPEYSIFLPKRAKLKYLELKITS